MWGNVESSRRGFPSLLFLGAVLVAALLACSTSSSSSVPKLSVNAGSAIASTTATTAFSGERSSVRAKPSELWEEVARSVELVASDPTRNALHIRTGSGVVTLAGPRQQAGKNLLSSLHEPPAFATAVITDHRALRWHTEEAGWQGVGSGEGGRAPALAELGVAAGMLFHTPLEGPGFARPIPLCDVSGPLAEPVLSTSTVLVGGRGAFAVAVKQGRAWRISLDECRLQARDSVHPLDIGARRVLDVRPAFGPSGDFVVLAVEDAASQKGKGASPFEVLLVEAGTGNVVEALPVQPRPLALHVAAGSVLVEVEDGSLRRLLRHPHATLESTGEFRTELEKAVAALRGRLLDETRENLARGRIGEAVDRLDVLHHQGLLDQLSRAERKLVADVKAAARKRIDTEISRAVNEGDLFVAALLDRRAEMIDGERRLPREAGVPLLALSVIADQDTGIDHSLIQEELAAPWREVADGCGGLRAAGVPCVSLDVTSRSLGRDEAERRRRVALTSLRRTASSWVSRRAACEEERFGPSSTASDGGTRESVESFGSLESLEPGIRSDTAQAHLSPESVPVLTLLFEHTEAGPRAASECELEVEGWRAAQELDELWEELARVAAGSEHRIRVELEDGSQRDGSLSRAEDPRSLLFRAVDKALRLQGIADREKRWPRRSGSLPSLRTLLWRDGGSARELERVVDVTGEVRIPRSR